MRRVNDLSGDCCLWGINAQEESILGVKLVGWKIQEEKVLGGKNSGERWGPASRACYFEHFWQHIVTLSLYMELRQDLTIFPKGFQRYKTKKSFIGHIRKVIST